MQNPLLVDFSTPFETLPFDQINTADFLPALEAEIEKTKAEIDQITQNPAQPSFDNTIEAMEKSGKKLGIISGALFMQYRWGGEYVYSLFFLHPSLVYWI